VQGIATSFSRDQKAFWEKKGNWKNRGQATMAQNVLSNRYEKKTTARRPRESRQQDPVRKEASLQEPKTPQWGKKTNQHRNLPRGMIQQLVGSKLAQDTQTKKKKKTS